MTGPLILLTEILTEGILVTETVFPTFLVKFPKVFRTFLFLSCKNLIRLYEDEFITTRFWAYEYTQKVFVCQKTLLISDSNLVEHRVVDYKEDTNITSP